MNTKVRAVSRVSLRRIPDTLAGDSVIGDTFTGTVAGGAKGFSGGGGTVLHKWVLRETGANGLELNHHGDGPRPCEELA